MLLEPPTPKPHPLGGSWVWWLWSCLWSCWSWPLTWSVKTSSSFYLVWGLILLEWAFPARCFSGKTGQIRVMGWNVQISTISGPVIEGVSVRIISMLVLSDIYIYIYLYMYINISYLFFINSPVLHGRHSSTHIGSFRLDFWTFPIPNAVQRDRRGQRWATSNGSFHAVEDPLLRYQTSGEKTLFWPDLWGDLFLLSQIWASGEVRQNTSPLSKYTNSWSQMSYIYIYILIYYMLKYSSGFGPCFHKPWWS